MLTPRSSSARWPILAAALFALSTPAHALAQTDPSGSLSGNGTFTMALTGDAIITRAISPFKEPEFLRLMELVRSADVSFTNLEMLFHDYEPSPASQSGGTYMRAEPKLAKELVWAGFDLVSMANNHTGDYSYDGMRLTRKHAEAAGLVTAGAGEDLYEAREARFVETHEGRVALISASSTFGDASRAGAPRGGVRGRPGLNPLRFTSRQVVTPGHLEEMRGVLSKMGQRVTEPGQPLSVFGTRLEAGEPAGVRTEPHAGDLQANADVVRNAKALSDFVIVAIHAHTQGDYLKVFARAMIDAGATVVVGHGPHYLTGIEIYKGKPIFYSLGDFIFQNETLLRLPYDNYEPYGVADDMGKWVADFNASRYRNETTGFPVNREIWESVVAMPTWKDGRLVSLELHPITLGFGKPAAVRGRPMLADRELGRKIIQDLVERSSQYGTAIEWDAGRGIGVVTVPPPA
ncbi:MAG TPA: CapA family protein [Longimicrobiales bacterium]|nr:CapA family protein [Longimicrobiales bacterium]